VQVPLETPLTIPVPEPMAAVEGSLELQVPPGVTSPRVVAAPWQSVVVPVIGAGIGSTVSVTQVAQPVGNVYVMTGLPDATPVTIPEDEPTVARAVLELVQVPPVRALVRVITEPAQTFIAPAIAAVGFTVTIVVVVQPVGNV